MLKVSWKSVHTIFCNVSKRHRHPTPSTPQKRQTRAVRDCLIRPYARISECLVSCWCLVYEFKIGHSDPIPVKCELKISCNLLNLHTNSQIGISESTWTTRWKSVGIKRYTIHDCVPNMKNLWGHKCRTMLFLCPPPTPLDNDSACCSSVIDQTS